MAETKGPGTLAKKLVQIMAEIAKTKVGKNGINEYHRYKYVKASDITAILAEKLVLQKIASIVEPQVLESKDIPNSKGGIDHLVTVQTDVLLIDVDSGETIKITGLGSGQDTGDKAIMKAQTAALKYAYMMSFNIATNDDPEADEETDRRTTKRETKPEKKTRGVPEEKGNLCLSCTKCGTSISEKVSDYSKEKYGKPLCYECQRTARKSA